MQTITEPLADLCRDVTLAATEALRGGCPHDPAAAHGLCGLLARAAEAAPIPNPAAAAECAIAAANAHDADVGVQDWAMRFVAQALPDAFDAELQCITDGDLHTLDVTLFALRRALDEVRRLGSPAEVALREGASAVLFALE